jgi:hypothetical protein
MDDLPFFKHLDPEKKRHHLTHMLEHLAANRGVLAGAQGHPEALDESPPLRKVLYIELNEKPHLLQHKIDEFEIFFELLSILFPV